MSGNKLEAEVAESLGGLKQRYKHLQSLTVELGEQVYSSPEFQNNLEAVQAIRTEIESDHARSKALFDNYIKSNEHASTRVKELSSEITDIIQKLVISFQNLENQTRESSKHMQPVVTEALRSVQMKSAYNRNSV